MMGFTPLMLACKYNNINLLKLLLKHQNVNINCTDNLGFTSLMMACLAGRTQVTKVIIF